MRTPTPAGFVSLHSDRVESDGLIFSPAGCFRNDGSQWAQVIISDAQGELARIGITRKIGQQSMSLERFIEAVRQSAPAQGLSLEQIASPDWRA